MDLPHRRLVLALLLCVPGCGSSGASTSPDASPSPSPGGEAAGGSADAEVDAASGDAGAAACPTGQVTFAFQLAPGSTTDYCLAPGGCGDGYWLSIQTTDGGTLSPYAAGCLADCTSCQPVACGNVCAIAGMLGDAGTTMSWNGSYVETTTCGPTALACYRNECAGAGTYVAHMCGYAEPPSSGYCLNPSTTPTCIDVPFAWPPDGGMGTVVGQIGTPGDGGTGD